MDRYTQQQQQQFSNGLWSLTSAPYYFPYPYYCSQQQQFSDNDALTPSSDHYTSLYIRVRKDYGEVCWFTANLNVEENWTFRPFISMWDSEINIADSMYTVVNSSLNCFGSLDGSSRSSEVWILDTKHMQPAPLWARGPFMLKQRENPQVVSHNGSIYVMGGVCEDDQDCWAEVLKPESKRWEPLPSPPPEVFKLPRFFIADVHCSDKIFLGSWSDNSIYLFHTETRVWEKLEVDYFPRGRQCSLVAIGNTLYWFENWYLFAYNFERKILGSGKIVGLEENLLPCTCGSDELEAKLLYLGGTELCLVILESDSGDMYSSIIRCFKFPFPVTRYDGDLYTTVCTMFSYRIKNSTSLLDALLV